MFYLDTITCGLGLLQQHYLERAFVNRNAMKDDGGLPCFSLLSVLFSVCSAVHIVLAQTVSTVLAQTVHIVLPQTVHIVQARKLLVWFSSRGINTSLVGTRLPRRKWGITLQ